MDYFDTGTLEIASAGEPLRSITEKIHMTFRKTCQILAIATFFSVPILGQPILYDMTFTGTDLLVNSNATFPTRAPTSSGASLLFGTGNVPHETIMRLPLVSAGTIPASTLVVVTYEITMAHLTGENDIFWLLGDGSLVLGAEVADNVGGFGSALAWDLPTTAQMLLERETLFSGAGYPPVGTSHEITVKICISDLMTKVHMAFGTESNSANLMTTLDETQALELVLVADDAFEQYRIDMLRVRMVEVPASIAKCPIFIDGFESGDVSAWSTIVN